MTHFVDISFHSTHAIVSLHLLRTTPSRSTFSVCVRYSALFSQFISRSFWLYAFVNFLSSGNKHECVILFDQLHLSAMAFALSYAHIVALFLFPLRLCMRNVLTREMCTPTLIKWENKQTHSHLSGNHICSEILYAYTHICDIAPGRR